METRSRQNGTERQGRPKGIQPRVPYYPLRAEGSLILKLIQSVKWCPGAESNHRHCDFQSHALPTELPGQFRVTERCRSGRVIERSDGAVHPSGVASGLFFVFVAQGAAGNGVGAGQPTVQIDIPAARGAERLVGLGGRLAAGRAWPQSSVARAPGALLARTGRSWALSRHSTSRTGSESPRRRAVKSTRTAAGRRHWCRNRPS
jgi:hypothetical protein